MYYDAFETNWGWVAAAGTAQGLRYTTLPEPSLRVALDDLVSIMRTPLPEQQPGGFEVFQQQLSDALKAKGFRESKFGNGDILYNG